MSIWQGNPTLREINHRGSNTLVSHLKIKVTELKSDCLIGIMPVDSTTKQPAGLLHGGASCVLAETLGSTAANMCIDRKKFIAVGLEINANHIRSATSGTVTGIAKPLHIGRSTQVWEIVIKDENDRLICVSRLTMAIKELKR
ncbi:MAG: hotdog fold thioesterase [Halobacteriovoraceae bacterium]|nr:hotdog fold thioesterase [Halobacteriovoraceae bacterium]